MLEYLEYFESKWESAFIQKTLLFNFSSPTHEDGYADTFITNDLVTDIYMEFVSKARQGESIAYGKTRTGTIFWYCLTCSYQVRNSHERSALSVSLDNTFKSAAKATTIDKNKNCQSYMKGGALSALNEENEGLGWVSTLVSLFFIINLTKQWNLN